MRRGLTVSHRNLTLHTPGTGHFSRHLFDGTLLVSVCTGPFNVTTPSAVMILMLCAFVESDLSATMALRI